MTDNEKQYKMEVTTDELSILNSLMDSYYGYIESRIDQLDRYNGVLKLTDTPDADVEKTEKFKLLVKKLENELEKISEFIDKLQKTFEDAKKVHDKDLTQPVTFCFDKTQLLFLSIQVSEYNKHISRELDNLAKAFVMFDGKEPGEITIEDIDVEKCLKLLEGKYVPNMDDARKYYGYAIKDEIETIKLFERQKRAMKQFLNKIDLLTEDEDGLPNLKWGELEYT